MKQHIAIVFCFALLGYIAPAQEPSPTSAKQVEDRGQIEKVLKKYTDAYDHHDLSGVLKVFPDLETQKKELRKTQERFENPRISNTRLELEILETRPSEKGTVVQCRRTERYDQLQYSSYESGDATIGGMPVQRPGPTKMENKKTVSKTGQVWITLNRDRDSWTISSISDKQPH